MKKILIFIFLLLTTTAFAANVTITNVTLMNNGLTVSNHFSADSVSNGVGPNVMAINTNGEMRLIGEATQFDDLRFPAYGNGLDTTSGQIDYDMDNEGIIVKNGARTNANNEKLHIIVQMPHAWKTNSYIYPHIHWIQPHTNQIKWYIEHRWYGNGETNPVEFTFEGPGSNVFNIATGLQITAFGPWLWSPISSFSLSSFIDVKISRDGPGDGSSANVLYKMFDIHYEVDSFGSNTELSK